MAEGIPTSGGLSGYAQSKWVLDSLCLLAAGRGLPVTIHRPARILASTRTGVCNPNDLHVRLAVGAVQLGSLPSGLIGVEYGAAVDHVAAAIVVLGLNAQRKGEYGCTGACFTSGSLTACIESAGYRATIELGCLRTQITVLHTAIGLISATSLALTHLISSLPPHRWQFPSRCAMREPPEHTAGSQPGHQPCHLVVYGADLALATPLHLQPVRYKLHY